MLDLFIEFRNLTNGLTVQCGNGLVGALAWFGLNSISVTEKKAMRDLAQRDGPLTPEEEKALLDYCESDVDALGRLLPRLLPSIDMPLALLRGRYMIAAAHIEAVGVPVDVEAHQKIVKNWGAIKETLIDRIDADYNVYEGVTFKRDRFVAYLRANSISWPLLPTGQPKLDDDTFREMARAHPEVAPLRELRVSLSQLRLSDLEVGADGRNRCLLSAFRARTSRNQPSTSKFVFGLAVWLLSLIKRELGRALAYLDYSQQEFGIAAALSGDTAMLAAYQSGNPYLAFARQAGMAPPTATKLTHQAIRELCEACALGVQYEWRRCRSGRGSVSLLRELVNCLAFTGQPIAGSGRGLTVRCTTPPPRTHLYGVWLAPSPRGFCQSEIDPELPDAGQRSGDAAPRLLPRYRRRHLRLRPCARRDANRGAC